jgi:hypothetical protein
VKKKGQALSTLLTVFPTIETFSGFSKNPDNKKTLPSLIFYAMKNDLIKTEDGRSLQAFIRQHSRSTRDLTAPNHLTFEALFERREEILKMNLSGRALTDRIKADPKKDASNPLFDVSKQL